LKSEVDDYTLAQGALFLREAIKLENKRNAQLAYTIVACAFDQEAWKKIIKDI
jgi:hypothetical protein